MTADVKRWRIRCGWDLSQGPHVWTLGLYWRPLHELVVGRLRCQRYVELCLNTSNPFWLHHRLK